MKKFLLLGSLAFVAISIWSLVEHGFDMETLFQVLFFGGCALVLVFQDQIRTWSETQGQKQIKKKHCQIKHDCFYFPKHYIFRHGFLKGKKKLSFDLVEEIRINTWPISAKINNNELIFLFGLSKEEVIAVASEKGLSIVEPQDNWSLLLEKFLDTEFDEEEKQQTLSRLEAAGIDKSEVEKIRKRFQNRMLLTTLFSMEWIYYGQFDALRQIWPLTEQKYWWTMKLALKENRAIFSP